MTLNYGSIHIERGTGSAMNFYGFWEIDYEFEPQIVHYPGDTHSGFDFGTIKRTVYIVNATFKTTEDAEAYISGTKTLQLAGAYTLELQIESSDYFEIDGSTTSIEVLCKKISRLKPVSQGYGTPKVYQIPFIILEEAG